MGQGQSSASDAAAEEDHSLKEDYYDLLGVERTATDDELKKAYRRKALELHPDRNYGNVDHATRLFAEIQTAYEILSDPQERAWYDSHRDVLLRGDQAGREGADEFSYNIRITSTDEVLRLMLKFNGRLEYTDAPSGFYGGVHDFFKQLAKQEDIACQWEDQDPMDYPEFGSKEDSYDDVVRPFYAAWNGFATRKSYAWKDHYKLSEAPDRRIRRLMEKENKKLREEAIQEYNDAVRSLVAFLRKRDPRIRNNQKSEAERQKALRDAAAAQAARSRAARQAKLQELDNVVIPDWAKSRTQEEHEGDFSSESEVEEHEYDCVVCDKIFKSEAQFRAHEKSKKHIKQLKQLKRELRAEGTELEFEPKGKADGADALQEVEDATEHNEDEKDATTGQDLRDSDGGESELEDVQPATNGHASKPESARPSDTSDDDYVARSVIEDRLAGHGKDDLATRLGSTAINGTPATSDGEASGQPKLGKAKQKRAKKAAQQAAGTGESTPSALRCAVCQAEFPSKTRLFSHIKEKNHAAPISQMKGGGVKGGKGKKQ